MFQTLRSWLTRSPGRMAGRRPKGVFISYRRSDSEPAANRLNSDLRNRLGGEVVFFDVDTIPAGEPFPEVIAAGIQSAQVVLVLIGKTWHETRDAAGNLRLHLEEDFVRREIELARAGDKVIIPVLIDGAELRLDDERLPESLRFLGPLNAKILRTNRDYGRDLDDLIAGLRQKGVSVSPRHWLRQNLAVLAFAATMVLSGGALLAVILLRSGLVDQEGNAVGTSIPAFHEPEASPSLLGHVSASDRLRLESASESSVVQIAGMCENEELQRLAEKYQDDPATLLSIISKEYLK
ncbi:toll/interleukin-1 receptor domain-containing protein [Zavarzinella formosa]|uniref:toll/interleukin-1 receptor domain-containing protein n=1 Tax=Zavarzinella formosa TaxID=360055 RepID=UPI0002E5EF68|nr:toll/interleukin-1 receptor domain-containing protein [Zavarzinella formosa]